MNHVPFYSPAKAIGLGNITMGCKVQIDADTADFYQRVAQTPYTDGTFKWPIPWMVTPDNGLTTIKIATMDHLVYLWQDQTTWIGKCNAKGTNHIPDGNQDY